MLRRHEPSQDRDRLWREFTPVFQRIAAQAADVFAPRPRLNVPQWAEAHRRLSGEASSKRGAFKLLHAPYQREPMESVTDPEVQSTVLMWASQMGKTELVNNVVGYHMDQDPAPMLVLQPTLDMAETWSKDRLTPMIRDTPVLRGRILQPRAKESGNTILHKRFIGGHVTCAGANSPASLASRPIRVLIEDEIDRYPPSAGPEGDPCALAEKRTDTFWNAVIIKTSTPTVKGISRIESDFHQTDQRYFFCPCPRCGHFQKLQWAQVKFEFEQPDGTVLRDTRRAVYVCENKECAAHLTDAERCAMIRAGEWRPTAPFTGKRGYHLNGLYSLFKAKRGFATRLHQFAEQFLDAHQGGVERLKVWTNTFLAETWEEETEKLELAPLLERREPYGPELPQGVLVLVAGLDVQNNRIEGELVGYGHGEETWAIDYRQFIGDPERTETWNAVDDWLSAAWTRVDGAVLRLGAAFIDSAHKGKAVYQFVRSRQVRRIFACRGSNQRGAPLIQRPRVVRGASRVMLYLVGTDVAKETIYSRLRLETPGPRYLHFPLNEAQYGESYFLQLTAEVVRTRYRHGYPVREWEKIRERNEALDIRVYAQAAFEALNPNLPRIEQQLAASATKPPAPPKDYQLKPPANVNPPNDPASPVHAPEPKKPAITKSLLRPKTSFVQRWKKW